jgi:hypothetical protein
MKQLRFLLPMLALLLAACGSRATPDNYAKLEAGMTREQVHAILGDPDKVSGNEVGNVLSLSKETWNGRKSTITVTFGNNALALKSIEPIEAK